MFLLLAERTFREEGSYLTPTLTHASLEAASTAPARLHVVSVPGAGGYGPQGRWWGRMGIG